MILAFFTLSYQKKNLVHKIFKIFFCLTRQKNLVYRQYVPQGLIYNRCLLLGMGAFRDQTEEILLLVPSCRE